jgi:hypothetical protein
MGSGYRPAANPLDGVQRKLEWADKHIVDLGHELAAFRAAKAKAVIRENDPNRPGYSRWILTDASIPDPITLILGDAIHNLRSALDHFANAIVRDNGKQPSFTTDFPIWRSPKFDRKEYEATVDTKVGRAAKPVVQEFKGLEPHEGGKNELLWALDKLDVVDKHRFLVVLALRPRSAGFSAWGEMKKIVSPERAAVVPNQFIYTRPADRAPLEDGSQIYSAAAGSHLEPDDQPDFLFDVALGEPGVLKGQTVLEAFALLRNAVTEIINLLWAVGRPSA